MSLDRGYLEYPNRRRGMDQSRYKFRAAADRPKVTWPGGARVALWIVPALEFFPLDMTGKPFRLPGAMERPYPDYWNYTLRDYGNRVGVFRVFEALDERGLKASVAINSRLAERTPFLVDEVTRRGWEVVAHGVDMGRLHHAGVSEAEERALVSECLATLRARSGQPVAGWLSPGMSESWRTPDLLAEAGIDYICDWANDDMPYAMHTRAGDLQAMPHAFEIDDLHLFAQYKHRPQDFVDQVVDHFRLLYGEAADGGGRIMALSLHPWIVGVPHRIKALEDALDAIMAHAGVWSATGAEILTVWRAQVTRP